jgi:hypothetical protein
MEKSACAKSMKEQAPSGKGAACAKSISMFGQKQPVQYWCITVEYKNGTTAGPYYFYTLDKANEGVRFYIIQDAVQSVTGPYMCLA